jgi:hypothetical protein
MLWTFVSDPPKVVLIITELNIPSFIDATVSYLHIVHPSHRFRFFLLFIPFIKVAMVE